MREQEQPMPALTAPLSPPQRQRRQQRCRPRQQHYGDDWAASAGKGSSSCSSCRARRQTWRLQEARSLLLLPVVVLLLALAHGPLGVAASHRQLLQALRALHHDPASGGTGGGAYAHDITWASLFAPQLHTPVLQSLQPHAHPYAHHTHGGSSSTYRFMLSRRQRHHGITHYGAAERLRAVLSRAITNKKLSVAVVGGSISAGTGAEDAPSWVDRLEAYLRDSYGRLAGVNVTVNNGAVPGTTSAYMAACVNLHVPPDADVVVVEYSVNDDALALPPLDNPARRPYERLLRKLLAMPSRPAVVLLHAYAWHRPEPVVGSFFSNAERELDELALYYGLPALSVKGCCHAAMRANEPGFQVSAVREAGGGGGINPNTTNTNDNNLLDLKGLVFYYDEIHPDGNTGHRAMAELVIGLLQRAVADLLHSPLTERERELAAAPAPPPMVQGNHESLSAKCFVGPSFKEQAVQGRPKGWEWVNESRTPRPKWGYVATKPGATLRLLVNSTASSGHPEHPVMLQLGYLRSYEHMGKAAVECVSGCECARSEINGHHGAHTSLLVLHNVLVSQHDACELRVTVVAGSDSPKGQHKVKLAAAIVSEESGEAGGGGLDNPAAVEHVHDISFRRGGFGHGSVFDIRNHI